MSQRYENQPLSKPSIKMWVTAAFIYVILICFFLFQGGKMSFMLLTMATLLGVYWIVGWFQGIRRVVGKRTVGSEGHHHYVANSHIRVQLDIHIPGWLPLPYVIVKEQISRFEKTIYEFESVVTLDKERKAATQYLTPALPRGCYHFASTICQSKDLFGLFMHQGQFEATQTIFVLPQLVHIGHWRQSLVWHGANQLDQAMTRDRRESTNLNGIREYALGDKLSRVHWNATAKTGIMKSKQFEPEGLPPLVIAIDLSVHVYENPEQFEMAVAAMASIAAYSRTQQRQTMIIGVGEKLVIWSDEDVRYESLAFRQWLASVQRERTSYGEREEPQWISKWVSHPSLRKGGVVMWVSGRAGRNQRFHIAALAKRNWHGTYLHLLQSQPEVDNVTETTASLMKYHYHYIRISQLHELPVRLGGEAS